VGKSNVVDRPRLVSPLLMCPGCPRNMDPWCSPYAFHGRHSRHVMKSTHPPSHPSIHLSIHPSIHASLHPSIPPFCVPQKEGLGHCVSSSALVGKANLFPSVWYLLVVRARGDGSMGSACHCMTFSPGY